MSAGVCGFTQLITALGPGYINILYVGGVCGTKLREMHKTENGRRNIKMLWLLVKDRLFTLKVNLKE